jgi:hypothetical protein
VKNAFLRARNGAGEEYGPHPEEHREERGSSG